MLILIGRFTAKPEKKTELTAIAHRLFEPSRAEQGCITYRFYADTEVADTFIFLEEWDSQASLDQHFQTSHFAQFMTQFADMIVGKPVITTYDIQASQVLFQS
jgi:quinol monooxygenase YgiN